MDPPLNSGVKLAVSWVKAIQSNQRHKHQQARFLGSVFWDALGILFIDYLEKGRTINSEYYITLLVHLKEEIAEKQAQMKKKKVLFHQDTALCCKSVATMPKLHELHFELLSHSPYSLYLALSDYWLFADLKRMLQGKRFGSNEEVYHPRRRLCWWIKSNFTWKLLFY